MLSEHMWSRVASFTHERWIEETRRLLRFSISPEVMRQTIPRCIRCRLGRESGKLCANAFYLSSRNKKNPNELGHEEIEVKNLST